MLKLQVLLLCFFTASGFALELCAEKEWDPDLIPFGVKSSSSQGITIIKLPQAKRYSEVQFRNVGQERVHLKEIRVCFNQWPHEVHHMYDVPVYSCETITIDVPPSAYVCHLEIRTDIPSKFEARGLPVIEAP